MKEKVLLRFLILLGIISMSHPREVFSQASNKKFVVEGRILDPLGGKAVGATILVKGTTTGTVTNTDGFFTLQIPSEKSVLVIRHFSTSEFWEDSFEAGKEYVIRLTPDSLASAVPVFDKVEELPRPKTGDQGWYAYLSKNVKYPQGDRKNGVEGTVIVGFEVHADGSIQNVKVLRGIGGECDQEAARVVASGPSWQPGTIAGEAVNTRMSIPVQFKLSGAEGTLSNSKENAISKLYGENRLVVIGYLPQASR
ncbi:hypothetical protein GCM10009119_29500 [Algoriphagus jejuensis]|uniref:TonB C-terminal domain-containing protein n=1 Tax=Algoriphagus jejuensis TaxID=419934 RepID=A0ABP3YFH6_9BACT